MPNTQNLATVGVTNRQDTDNIIVEQGGNIRRVQYEDIKTGILRGDAADGTISTFEESAEEFPIPAPATPQKTLWGRVKKFCSDFNDWKTGVMLFGHLVNNAESDSDTLPLAASVAKLLQEQITTNAGAIATLNSEVLKNSTLKIYSLSSDNLDSGKNSTKRLEIGWGLIDSAFYLSIDMDWGRLQFKFTISGDVQTRAKYGQTKWGEWK